MEIIRQIKTWQTLRHQLNSHQRIGFVPTMGNLHAGHASLLEKSRQDNELSILSIYINPTQFNDPQDLKHYPRSLEADLSLARECKVDYVLIPEDYALYPDHFTYQITTQHPLSQIMEGIARPQHFTGVLTVVMKLLILVKATNAYFGEKDYQQLKLIEDLVNAFFLNTKIIACPTIRENSGLALSSRNNLLSAAEREQAAQLAAILQQDSNCNTKKQQLLAGGFTVDYVEEHGNRIFAAVKLGRVRLIDNISKKCT